MKRVVIIVLTALAATAVAQPDPTVPPSGSGSAIDPGSGSGSASGSGSGSAIDPGPGSASGSAGSGSGSGGPRIIQVPTDMNAPTVSAAAAPTEVKLGGKFTLFVTATFAPGVVVNLQEPLDLGPAFEITRKLSEDTSQPDGRTTREWQIEVIAWELGDLGIPPVAVTYTSGGKALQVATNMAKVRVIGVLGDVVDDPKAMRGNAEPNDLLIRDWFWLWVASGGLVLLVLVIWMIAYVRRRRRRVAMVGGFVSTSTRKFDTPASRALAKLLAIESSGVLDRDDDRKTGYAEMVDVVREYLGTRYRVATYDLTTYELMRQLTKVASPDDQKLELQMIERWLESCDIVKYGGLKASAGDARHTLEGARELVLTTSQTAPAVAAAQPAPAKPVAPAVVVDPVVAEPVVTRADPVAELAAEPAAEPVAPAPATATAGEDDPTTRVDKVEAEPASRDEIPAATAADDDTVWRRPAP